MTIEKSEPREMAKIVLAENYGTGYYPINNNPREHLYNWLHK